MDKVTAVELQRNSAVVQDRALVEPLAITRHGRERLVLLSFDEHQRLKRRDREVMAAHQLSDETLRAIAETKVPAGNEHLNDEY
jgi:PHD/YefM family antitoxin component YafN of YafNO toxin-antitoxin module